MTKKRLYPVKWDIKAVDELGEIFSYVSRKSQQAQQIIKQELKKSIEIIKTKPLAFEKDKLKTGNDGTYRAFVVYSYRVSYRFFENKILILRIRHTSKEPLEY